MWTVVKSTAHGRIEWWLGGGYGRGDSFTVLLHIENMK